MKKILSSPFIYLGLFSIYPLFHFYAQNADQVGILAPTLLTVAVIIFVGIIFAISRVFLKDNTKASILATVISALFFSYGHIFSLVRGWKVGIFDSLAGEWVIDWTFGKHLYIGLLYGIIVLGTIWALLRYKKISSNLVQILNVTALALIVLPLITLGQFYSKSISVPGDHPTRDQHFSKLAASAKKPDIYYIMLDEHAREDVLLKYFGADNSKFIQGLKDRGFCVSDQSNSNYSQTLLSLPSTLNMKYLDYIPEKYGEDWPYLEPVKPILYKSYVQQALDAWGYTTISFPTGFIHTDNISHNVDIALAPTGYLSEFVNDFLTTTPLGYISIKVPSLSRYRLHRDRILYVLNKLPDITEIKAPTYTFAHIISPHRPFVFDEEGRELAQNEPFGLNNSRAYSSKDYLTRYPAQTLAIDDMVLATIDQILKRSDQPPVIILQSDHGATGEFHKGISNNEKTKIRMANLSALLLPGVGCGSILSDFTPVNNFRVVFDSYLGTDYGLLENRSYFSSNKQPFKFEDVTELVHGKVKQ